MSRDRVRRRRVVPLTKSEQMSLVRTRHTAPELALRKALWATGLRYQLHPKLPGRPDFAFPAAHVAVFIDGCFWHCCPEHGTMPRTNEEFWKNKLARNVSRDRWVDAQLAGLGWRVFRIWEHDVEETLPGIVAQIARAVRRRRRLKHFAENIVRGA
jgi:DNA mismatch endonuclease (patch repair protein)